MGAIKYPMEYRRGNLLIESDFEIRTIMEDGSDIDLFIPIDYRTLNLEIDDLPSFMDNRIQLNEVRSIIIRFSMEEGNNYCTIHFLKNIDLQSATMNFVMDYSEHRIRLTKGDYSSEMHIFRKEE